MPRSAPIFASANGEITAGTIPSFTSEKANTALSPATAMSAQATSPAPPPRAWPWTRATTGAGQRSIASSMPRRALASATFASKSSSTEPRIQSTSAPAQKLGPSPARNTARPCRRRRTPPRAGDQRRVEGVAGLRPRQRDLSRSPSRSIRSAAIAQRSLQNPRIPLRLSASGLASPPYRPLVTSSRGSRCSSRQQRASSCSLRPPWPAAQCPPRAVPGRERPDRLPARRALRRRLVEPVPRQPERNRPRPADAGLPARRPALLVAERG